MKKVFVLILISIFLVGCSIKKIDNSDINKMIDTILLNANKLANVSSNGYKYYLPASVRIINSENYNEELYANGNTYYLYIDIVSYYYKKNRTYQVNDKAYFFKRVENNKKSGYLEINRIGNLYYIKMMYNYARIETYVSEKDIPETITNITYILTSIKYNDIVIKMLFDNNTLDFSEQKFTIFEPKRKEGNFLDYINEYDKYKEKDEDVISSNPNMTE